MDAGIDGHEQEVLPAKADVDIGRALQTAQEQTGDADQYKRHGDLCNNEEIAKSKAAAGPGESIFSLERVGKHGTGCGPRRSEAEEDAAEKAESKGIEKYAPVERNVNVEWNWGGQVEGGKTARGQKREENAEGAAAKAQEHAFDEHLVTQAAARGAEREADGHFALTRSSLSEEEIGNVGAGDGEHQQDHNGERGKKQEHAALFAGRQ